MIAKVWVLGDAVVDLLPESEGRLLRCPGGAPANVAVGIARLGGISGFIGRVGDDPFGRFMRHSGWYPDRVMRLYERDRYRYNDNLVHESLDGQGAQVIELAGDLLHLTCRDFSGFQQKQLAYAAAWAQERHQRGKKTSLAAIFGHTLGAFVKTLLLRGGVLDGKQGWLLAVVNAQYTFNKYTELWALSRGYSEKVSL